LKLNIDTDNAWINADGERLSQLLDNLVMNAISYTDSPGHIDMQLTATDNEVRLVISDSAPGIDPATYGKIFDPLYRAEDSRNRRRGGAGLGLAICQNIVSAHSGSLVAGDSELGGVSMTVTLQRVETPIEARS
ncbi:MAG: ATP-binding protein, partial [Pseudomonadota bacterium]